MNAPIWNPSKKKVAGATLRAVERCERLLALLGAARDPVKIERFAGAFEETLHAEAAALARPAAPKNATGLDLALAPISNLPQTRQRAAAWGAVERAGAFKQPGSASADRAFHALRCAVALDAGPDSLPLARAACERLSRPGMSLHKRALWAKEALSALSLSNPAEGYSFDDVALEGAAKTRLLLRLAGFFPPTQAVMSIKCSALMDMTEWPLQSQAAGAGGLALGLFQELDERLGALGTFGALEPFEARAWAMIGAEALGGVVGGAFEAERARAASRLLVKAVNALPLAPKQDSPSNPTHTPYFPGLWRAAGGPSSPPADPMAFALAAEALVEAGAPGAPQFSHPNAREAFDALQTQKILRRQVKKCVATPKGAPRI
jgi:hypothetical protein